MQKPKPPTPAEQLAMLERILAGDEVARREIVTRNLPLVWEIARHTRIPASGYPTLEDLVQVGALALHRHVHRWDPELGAFATFAGYWIRAAIGRHVRENLGVVHTAHRSIRFLLARAEAEPTSDQGHRVRDAACRALGAQHAASLDAPLFGEDGEMTGLDLLEAPGPSPEQQVIDADLARKARRALSAVPQRSREILLERADGSTLDEAGERRGLSRERIRQLEASALPVVRRAMGA